MPVNIFPLVVFDFGAFGFSIVYVCTYGYERERKILTSFKYRSRKFCETAFFSQRGFKNSVNAVWEWPLVLFFHGISNIVLCKKNAISWWRTLKSML